MSRSSWKNILEFNKNIDFNKKNNKIFLRNNIITSNYIDSTVQIYNGIRFFELTISKNMVGHKFGEFSPSRAKPIHKKKKINKHGTKS